MAVGTEANVKHTRSNDHGMPINDDLSEDDDGGSESRPLSQQRLGGTVQCGLGPDFWDNFDAKIKRGGTDHEDYGDGLNVYDVNDNVIENNDDVDVNNVNNDAGDNKFSC